jgi:hypothetical protein
MYQEEINRHWEKIAEIASGKDEARVDELRINAALLHQFLHRKKVFNNGKQDSGTGT